MSRLTGSEARGLMGAYNSIFYQTEVEMHVVKEEGLDEDTNSDIKNFFKKTTKELTKEIESKANYIRGGLDNIGSSVSGVSQGMGFPDLEKVGRSAEKIIGSGGGTAKPPEPPVAKPKPRKPLEPAKPAIGTSGGLKLEGWGPFLTQQERDEINKKAIKGYKPKSTSRVTAPKGQELGTQVPGKPETWKPSQDPELLKTYKEKRGTAQLAKDKAAQAQARQSALKLAADEKATPSDEKGTPVGARRISKPKPIATAKPKPTPAPTRQPAPPASPVAKYMATAAAARKSGDPAQMAQARDMGLDIWRKKYADTLAKNVNPDGTQKRTGQSVMAKQSDDLRKLRPAATETGPQAQSSLPGGNYSSAATAKMSQRTKNILGVKEQYDAYDLVLEYLLSQGHVDTLEEAQYVMLQMDAEHIQNIVVEQPQMSPIFQNPASKYKYGQEARTAAAAEFYKRGIKPEPKRPTLVYNTDGGSVDRSSLAKVKPTVQPSVKPLATKPSVAPAPVKPTPKPQLGPTGKPVVGGVERRTLTSAELRAAQAARAAGKGEAGAISAVSDVAKSNQMASTSPTPVMKPEAPKRESLMQQAADLKATRERIQQQGIKPQI